MVSVEQSGWSQATTERLDLRAVSAGDLDVLYQLLSDPRVWSHFPPGVYTSRRQTARDAAASVRPGLPVAASVLAHNTASRAVAVAAGLHLAWEGPDPAGRTAGQTRLLFADRDLTQAQIQAMLRT